MHLIIIQFKKYYHSITLKKNGENKIGNNNPLLCSMRMKSGLLICWNNINYMCLKTKCWEKSLVLRRMKGESHVSHTCCVTEFTTVSSCLQQFMLAKNEHKLQRTMDMAWRYVLLTFQMGLLIWKQNLDRWWTRRVARTNQLIHAFRSEISMEGSTYDTPTMDGRVLMCFFKESNG